MLFGVRLVMHRWIGDRLGLLGSGWVPCWGGSIGRCCLELILIRREGLRFFVVSSGVDILRCTFCGLLVSFLYYEEGKNAYV